MLYLESVGSKLPMALAGKKTVRVHFRGLLKAFVIGNSIHI